MAEWRAIPEWPYKISDTGEIRRTGRACGTRPGHVVKSHVMGAGYRRALLRKNGTKALFSVHRLVALAWLGPCPVGCEVNHKDGDKLNNAVSNLEYVSAAENREHAQRMNLIPRGERHGRAKLTEDQVRDIRQWYATGCTTMSRLAQEYGVNQTMIGFIVRRENWTHVN